MQCIRGVLVSYYRILVNQDTASYQYNGTDGRYVITDIISGCHTIQVVPVLVNDATAESVVSGEVCVPVSDNLMTTSDVTDELNTSPIEDVTDDVTSMNRMVNASPIGLTEIILIVIGGIVLISLLSIICTVVVCFKRRTRQKRGKAKRMTKSRVEDSKGYSYNYRFK